MEQVDTTQTDVLDLRDYLDVLRRQAWVIVATVVVVAAVALAFSLRQTPMYQAETRVAVEPPSSAGQIEQLLFGSTDLGTQIEIASSRPVVQKAFETADVGLDAASTQDIADFIDDDLDISVVEGSTVMAVAVTHEDPEVAADLSQAVADAYLVYLREDAEERSAEAVADLDTQEQTTREQLRSLQAQLTESPGSTQESLEEERDNLQAQLRWIATRRAELDSVQAFMRRGDIIQPALVSQEPVSPKPLRSGVLAVVLGGMLGVGLGFLRDWMDDRLHTSADVVRVTGVAPLAVLGPAAQAQQLEEGIRVLRTNLTTYLRRHDSADAVTTTTARGTGVLQVAPVVDDTEGWALVDLLAAAFARAGHRTVVVDARGAHAQTAAAVSSLGLSDYLTGRADVEELVQPGTQDRIDRVAAGSDAIADSELLSSPRMTELLADLRSCYDVVLVAAPPATTSAAPLDLGVLADGTVLVVTMDRTERSQLDEAITRMQQVDAPVIGIVTVDGELPDPADEQSTTRGTKRQPVRG